MGSGRGERSNEPEGIRRYLLPAAEMGALAGHTLVAALLPVMLRPHTDSTVAIGAVVAINGVFAVLMPYAIGALSDSLPRALRERFGRRGFFLVVAAPVMAAALVFLPFNDSFWSLAGAATIFFAALHSFKTPLRTLVIESVDKEHWGRVQGALGALHAAGIAYGLVGGGLLYSIARPLPFLIAAVLVLATLATTWTARPESDRENRPPNLDRERADPVEEEGETAFLRELLGRKQIRHYLTANFLWDAGTDGIVPYIFLFATVVIGLSIDHASLVIASMLGAILVGSVLAGWLGDRYGRGRVLFWGLLLTGTAMLAGVFVRSVPTAIAFLIPAGFGAAALVALPYAVFGQLASDLSIGRSTGIFDLSTGLAALLAPVAIGGMIDIGQHIFPEQQGYPAMWPLAGLLVLASAAVFHAVRSEGLDTDNG